MALAGHRLLFRIPRFSENADNVAALPGAMSIHATLWQLRSPRAGDAYLGRDWVDVLARGVPAQIGTPTPG